MTTFEKIELWTETKATKTELIDTVIELINNNEVNLDALYLDHKNSIDKAVNSDLHL